MHKHWKLSLHLISNWNHFYIVCFIFTGVVRFRFDCVRISFFCFVSVCCGVCTQILYLSNIPIWCIFMKFYDHTHTDILFEKRNNDSLTVWLTLHISTWLLLLLSLLLFSSFYFSFHHGKFKDRRCTHCI